MKSIKEKTEYRGYGNVIKNYYGCCKCGKENVVSILSTKPFTTKDFESDVYSDKFIVECSNCDLIDHDEFFYF